MVSDSWGPQQIFTHKQKNIISLAQSVKHLLSNSNYRTLRATASLKLSDLFLLPLFCQYLHLCIKVASTDVSEKCVAHMQESAKMNLGETPAYLLRLVMLHP